HWRPPQRAPGELFGVDAEVDRQADPGLPAVVVAAHAMHHCNGVSAPGEDSRDRSSRALPGDAEALSSPERVVEMTGQCVYEQPPTGGQVILAAIERQASGCFGPGGGTGQVTGGQVDLG